MILSLVMDATGGQADQLISALINWGPGGVMLALILTGRLVPRRMVDDKDRDLTEYKALLSDEQGAHAQTRAALADQSRRIDAAVEAARVTQQLLDGFQHPKGQS